ncbi:hypothetical protein GA0115239_111225 [Streptomyces sp. BpilaLS-43]|nr:hypothetical protein GA0115239_111225 [Streptomyces sp. BpilaLS-43]
MVVDHFGLPRREIGEQVRGRHGLPDRRIGRRRERVGEESETGGTGPGAAHGQVRDRVRGRTERAVSGAGARTSAAVPSHALPSSESNGP